jgi:hypothetical protein
VSTGEEIWSFDAHRDVVRDVQFSPDGRSLVSGSDDGSVRIWELPDRKEPSNDDKALRGSFDSLATQREHKTSRFSMPTEPMIFWTDRRIPGICRMKLDGSNAQSILWDLGEPRDLTLHNGTDLYFCDYGFDRISKTDLSGSAPQIVFTGTPGIRGIAVDDRSNKIYWTDRDLKKVFRGNLDGTDMEEILSNGLEYPYSIQIDPIANKLFVEDHVAAGIFRANLDGSDSEKFVAFPKSTLRNGGLVLDVEGRTLFYKDSEGRTIMRIGLNNDDEPKLVIRASDDVLGLTIDKKNKKLYWHDTAIRRSNLDGSQMETVMDSVPQAVKSIVIYHPPSPMPDRETVPSHAAFPPLSRDGDTKSSAQHPARVFGYKSSRPCAFAYQLNSL